MLRVLFSPAYCRLYEPVTAGQRVLDVGCFHTNNLVPFFDRGCNCYGIDINEDMVDAAKLGAKRAGIDVDLKQGSNRSIPYPDGHFDLLLSINTIHYETSMEDVGLALAEFRRVVRPRGRVFISTHGPLHFFQTTCRPLNDNRIEIRAPGDGRAGTIQTAFRTQQHLEDTCRRWFDEVETGTVIEKYPQKDLQFLWALCRRG